MANVLGAADKPDDDASTSGCTICSRRMPDAKVHLYGKAERPGRKIGHVNVRRRGDTADVAKLRERADAGGTLVVTRGSGRTDGIAT